MRLWILLRAREIATGLAEALSKRGDETPVWINETPGDDSDSLIWPAQAEDRQVRPGYRPSTKVDPTNKLSGHRPSRPSASGKVGATRVRPK